MKQVYALLEINGGWEWYSEKVLGIFASMEDAEKAKEVIDAKLTEKNGRSWSTEDKGRIINLMAEADYNEELYTDEMIEFDKFSNSCSDDISIEIKPYNIGEYL